MPISPLFLPGWLEFNQRKWGLKAEHVRFVRNGPEPAIEAAWYHDARGRVCIPPLNPYLPLEFTPTPTPSPARVERQWHEIGALYSDELLRRGLRHMLSLSPEVSDPRPWQWLGLQVGVRYTFCVPLPYDQARMDKPMRGQISKAERNGFVAELSTDYEAAAFCLKGTESRKGFSHRVTAEDLALGHSLLGPEHFRVYLVRAKDHSPACVSIVLHNRGARAIGWIGGTAAGYLAEGTHSLVDKFTLADLHAAGATGYDFAGANIPGVANCKSQWGGDLTPYYTLESPSLKGLLRQARGLAQWRPRR
ncbi:MAG TPA: hypothetical protein V6D47_12760 [Oscillatoriaceae cyanobacterium]